MRKIDAIVVHCTAHNDTAWQIGVREIRADHVNNRGWVDVGYHYVVRRNGEIECGRMESVIGAHAEGHNAATLGVAWVGIGKPSTEQYAALVRLVIELRHRYSVPVHRVFGHRELGAQKACPVIDMVKFREEVGR